MAVNQVIHPAADVLRAFALGKLDDTTSEVVMTHLDSCPECCKQVAALSGDDFIARLRQAHGLSKTPAPPKSLVEVAQAPKPPANQPPIANLPPELANNPQYQVLRELGRGGMGVVYLAKNKLMDRLEVLKVVNGTLLDHPGAVERFLREIRSAAKLNHANVVTAYSAVQNGQLLAFAMEYVEGQDLGTLVKSQGPLPVPHACFYVQQAAYGLQHAFEKQMVHRDIKPQNLILAREGKKHVVKVLDFGLAKVMREKSEDTGLTGEGQMLGTPDYIAPEQSLDAAKADIRADIYSLGCTLYYLLSGAAPFSANSLAGILLAHQLDEAKPLNVVRPDVPKELATVVRKMMAKSPDKRYQTPLEVVQALNPFVKQAALPKTSPELSTGTPKAAGVKPVKPVKPERPQVPVAQAKERPPLPGAPPPVGWDKLTESSVPAAQQRKSGAILNRRRPTPQASPRNKWLLVASLGVLLLAGVVGMWAAGVFRLTTPEGILVVDVNESKPDVYVDGDKMTVAWGKDGKHAEIRVKPGTRKVELKKDGFTAFGEEVELQDGKRRILTAKLVSQVPPLPPKKDNPPSPAKDTVELDLGGGVKLKMVRIPAKGKTFWMGSPKDEQGRGDDEEQHEVEFTHDFYLGVTEVTQAQYRAVMNSNPSLFCKGGGGKEQVADLNTDDFPVENVTWKQAKEYCEKTRTRLSDGQEYRLPTEAEWEYACRGARPSKDSFPFYLKSGPTSSLSGGLINFIGIVPYGNGAKGQYLGRTAGCGSFPDSVNAFGLYDMHGNVWEWCEDWYGKYPTERVTDPAGPPEGSDRVFRGGGWDYGGQHCRAANRYCGAPAHRHRDLGFRLARVPVR